MALSALPSLPSGLSHVAFAPQPTDATGLRVVRGRGGTLPRPLSRLSTLACYPISRFRSCSLHMSRLLGMSFPSRFSLEVFGCLAAMIAFGLDDMHRRRPKPKFLTSRVFAVTLPHGSELSPCCLRGRTRRESEPALPQPGINTPGSTAHSDPGKGSRYYYLSVCHGFLH